MKSNRLFPLFLLATALLCSHKAYAAFDIFLQIEGIPGESVAANRQGWIELDSFSHGITHPTTNQYPTHANFVYTKRLDKTTPPVNLRLNIGEPIPKMTVDFERIIGGGSVVVFYKVIMEDVLVVSAKSSGNAASSDEVVETLEVTYSKITWNYYPVDPKTGKAGSPVTSSWELKTQKSF